MTEECSDHTTEQKSQGTLMEALVDKVHQRAQQKPRTQEGGAHVSGSLSGSMNSGESLHHGSEGKKKLIKFSKPMVARSFVFESVQLLHAGAMWQFYLNFLVVRLCCSGC